MRGLHSAVIVSLCLASVFAFWRGQIEIGAIWCFLMLNEIERAQKA